MSGLVDRLPAGDGGAVEHEAFLEEVLIHEVGYEGDVLKLALGVGEADVDIFDFLVLHQLQSILYCAHHDAFRFGCFACRSVLAEVRYSSDRVVAGFAGADADGLFDGRDENLAVADLVGAGGGDDRLDRGVHHVVGEDDLDLHFGQEVHDIFGAAIEFRMALLAAEAFDFGYGKA